MLNRIMLLAGCFVLSSTVFANADCVRTATGKVICGNGEKAGSYNPNTGAVKKTEINDYGIKTTETSRGGEAKTKNGVGVVQTPGGKTCVKTLLGNVRSRFGRLFSSSTFKVTNQMVNRSFIATKGILHGLFQLPWTRRK